MRTLAGLPELTQVLRHARTPEDFAALGHLLSGPAVGLDVLDETFSGRWTTATGAILGEVAAFLAFRHPGMELVDPEVLGLPLADVYVAAQTAAASSWWGRRRRLVAVRDRLAPHLRPDAKVRPADVPALVENLWRVQTAVQQIAGRVASLPGMTVPEGWNPFVDPQLLERQVAWLRRAGQAVDGSSSFHVQLRKLIVAGMPVGPEAATAVARLHDSVTALLEVGGASADQLAAWTGDDGFTLRWSMTRPERGTDGSVLMSLRRWVTFLDTLEPLRYAGLFDARRLLVTGAIQADDAVRALDRGLAQASVTERLDATGLDLFDEGMHEKAITRFTAASRAVREHLTAALPAAVLGVAALRRRARRRAGRRAAARAGQAAPRAGRAPAAGAVRRADHLGDAVRAGVAGLGGPVLPGRLGAVRPGGVRRGVADPGGRRGRCARAARRPPSSSATPGRCRRRRSSSRPPRCPTTSSEVETAVEDEESILSECVQARVPRHWLSWHYRSQDESLIAFSNAQYYENRLSSFPAPTHGRASSEPDGRGVSLVRVPGTFHRSGAGRLLRTNPIEAKAIVAEIRRRFDAVPKWDGVDAVPSIGVVTFNAQQRSYIESLLRDADDERLAAALDRTDGEGLFVKNLENVQGDERDVVFFSTGFSPTADGTLPLNFGPLNRSGGERRLNVAITRARRQVVVFSSFDPEQLRAEETSSVGIKHLRAYLDMAERGTDVLPRSPRSVAVVDRHREQIAAALRERGLVVRTDVGLSEFRVDLSISRPVDPETPVAAVLLDGPSWARRGTVGDRDGLPVEVLGGLLRWPVVERVWLPAWLRDPAAVVDRLVEAVDAAPSAPALPRPSPCRRRRSSRSRAWPRCARR